MIWGCTASNDVGRLEFIEATMNKYAYLNILKRNLKQSAKEFDLGREYYFQQDNDPKHTANIIKFRLLYNIPKQLRTQPQSPDLNPIEHLWDSLKRKIRRRTITSKAMLKDVLLKSLR